MQVTLLDYMGSDLSVCKAARVSFNKEPENYTEEQNSKLIRYLAKHKHWTPFAHTGISLRVTAPLPIRTQCFKHKVGLVENECYSAETEVLTTSGFIHWNQVNEDTLLAVPNMETGQVNYEKPLSIIKKNYEGNMISLFGSGLAMQVTPKHEVFVWDKEKEEYCKYTAEYLFDNYRKSGYFIVTVHPFSTIEVSIISKTLRARIEQVSSTPYKGMVYCAETSTGLLITRKEGSITIGGNCSRRYIKDTPEIFMPEFRLKAESVKQGSSDEIHPMNQQMQSLYDKVTQEAVQAYEVMLDQGIAPEQARFVLPQGMETTWVWTGNLYSFFNFYRKRTDSHAQKEIRDLALMVGNICSELFPNSWRALNDYCR